MSKIECSEPNCNKTAVVYKHEYTRPLCAACYGFLVIQPNKRRRIPTK